MRVLILLLVLCLGANSALALDAPGRDRGWNLGLGFGMGRSDVNYLGGDVTEKLREGVNTEWRVGKMIGQRAALSFDYQGWVLEAGDLNVLSGRIRQGLQMWGLGFTWYPGNPENAWGGLVLRGSANAALAGFAITVIDEEFVEVEEARLDEWGFGFGLTAGYEWFLTETFAVGPMLNYGWLKIDEELVDSAHWVTMTILGTWYFF